MTGECVMESRQAGVFRLFIIMIFFGISIFFLNNNKKNIVTATHIDVCNAKTDIPVHFSLDQIYCEMNSLFLSHDIDLIVKTLSQFKDNLARQLVERMIQDKKIHLSCEEKATIIYGMLAYSCPKKNIQYEWLDLIIEYPFLHESTPALLSLARSKYADQIALFIAWGKDRQKTQNKAGLLANLAEQAFKRAVDDNDYAAVEILFSKKICIAQNVASQLLWDIVEKGKDSKHIVLLVDHAQADVNYSKDGKTLLIAAVEKNNIEIVRALLDEGAVVDRIIDNKSTALTIAMKNKYHSVELLLREYGA
jgi:ankyrin repeat protein